MTKDTQHLDFLISQYVDQTLDATTRRTIEQQIAADPIATALYKDHCEVQDVLEDWGNRLPMINWDEFDATLAVRLEQEAATMATGPISPFRRWSRVVAAAAALFIAGTVGYTWHAVTSSTNTIAKVAPQTSPDAGPQHIVNISKPAATGPSMDTVAYEHPPIISGGNKVVVQNQLSVPNTPTDGTALNDKFKTAGSAVSSAKTHKPDRTDSPSIIY